MCRRKEWHMIRAEWRLGIKQTQAYHNLDWHTTDNIAMSVKPLDISHLLACSLSNRTVDWGGQLASSMGHGQDLFTCHATHKLDVTHQI